MAKLSLLTDRITEIQEKNLKMYPFVFFESVTSAEIHYNLSNSMDVNTEEDEKSADISYSVKQRDIGHLKVSYHLKLDERMNGNLPYRFKVIEDSVRNLFWKEVVVEVFFNDKQMYKSENGRKSE